MLCVNLNIYIQFLFLFIKYRVGTVFSCFLLSLHRSIFFKLIILTQNHTSPLFFLSFVIVLRMVLYHNHHILIWNKEGVTDDAIFGKVRFKQGYYEMIIVIKKNELKSIIVRHMYPTWYIKNWVLWKVRHSHRIVSRGGSWRMRMTNRWTWWYVERSAWIQRVTKRSRMISSFFSLSSQLGLEEVDLAGSLWQQQ